METLIRKVFVSSRKGFTINEIHLGVSAVIKEAEKRKRKHRDFEIIQSLQTAFLAMANWSIPRFFCP